MPYESIKRAILETKYSCNLKCQSCGLWKNNYRKLRQEEKELLDLNNIEQVYKKLAEQEIEIISFIGGEPFMDKNLIEKCEKAKKYGLIAAAVSNGTLFNKDILEKICENKIFKALVFSLDGPENIHDFIRGKKGAFKKLFESLKTLQKLKSQKKIKQPKVYIYSTISSLNYKYIEDIYKIAVSVNANKIRFQSASILTESIFKKTNEVLGFEAAKVHNYQNKLSFLKEERQKAKKTLKKLIDLKKSISLEIENALLEEKNKSCRFIGKDLVITPGGKVLLCPMLTNLIAGDIFKESLKEIFSKNEKQTKKLINLCESGKMPICFECCVEKIFF